jgi:hypothetical protein
MTDVVAIDPGPTMSAWVVLGEDDKPWGRFENNEVLLQRLAQPSRLSSKHGEKGVLAPACLAVEDITNMGMAVGKDVFKTMFWSGRFCQVWSMNRNVGLRVFSQIPRPEIKLFLCGSARAKDPNVRQALIDRYGGDEVAIGGKKCLKCKGKGWFGSGRSECEECKGGGWLHPPGPLHGFSGHTWSALAVAVTWKWRVR